MYSRTVVNLRAAEIERLTGTALREHSLSECDAFNKEIADWHKTVGPNLAALTQHLQQFITNEQRLSLIDFNYAATRYFQLISDKAVLGRFAPWPSQEYFLKQIAKEEQRQWELWLSRPAPKPAFKFKARYIWVKSRQVGGTRLAQMLGAHLTFLSRNTYSFIASETPEKGLELWRLLDTLYKNLPWWLAPKRDARVKGQEHFFEGIGSTVVVGAGNQKDSLGQGVRVDFFHLTEVSRYLAEVAEKIDDDLLPAFRSSEKPYALGLIESVAEGGFSSWFTKQWDTSVRGESQFIPLFLGWFLCPDKYTIYDPSTILTSETEAVGRRVEERFPDVKLTRDQLVWYQTVRREYTAKGKLDGFLRQYPTFPEEAFTWGTQSIFTVNTLDRVSKDIKNPIKAKRWGPGDEAPVTVEYVRDRTDDTILFWRGPEKGRVYAVSVDGSHGVAGGDSHAVQVIGAPFQDRPAEQVARWASSGKGQGIASISLVAQVATFLGETYKDQMSGIPAVIAPESNPGSPSAFVTLKLEETRYPNIYIHRRTVKIRGEQLREDLGWQTNEATKTPLILRLHEALESDPPELLIYDEQTLSEMRTFQKELSASGKAKYTAAEGKHDDLLVALAIAFWVATGEDVLVQQAESSRQAGRDKRQEQAEGRVKGMQRMIVLGILPEEQPAYFDRLVKVAVDWEGEYE